MAWEKDEVVVTGIEEEEQLKPWDFNWREFIEARDTVLTVLARPLLPSELLQAGPTLGPLLASPERERLSWHEAAQSTLTQLG